MPEFFSSTLQEKAQKFPDLHKTADTFQQHLKAMMKEVSVMNV